MHLNQATLEIRPFCYFRGFRGDICTSANIASAYTDLAIDFTGCYPIFICSLFGPAIMGQVSKADFDACLRANGGENCSLLMKDPQMYKVAFEAILAALKREATPMISSALSTVDLYREYSGRFDKNQRNLIKSAGTVASVADASLGLAVIENLKSPTAIYVTIGATTVLKVGVALSLVANDEKKLVCTAALMELAGSAGVTIATSATMTPFFLILTGASLAASAAKAYVECSKLQTPGKPSTPIFPSSPANASPASQPSSISIGPMG